MLLSSGDQIRDVIHTYVRLFQKKLSSKKMKTTPLIKFPIDFRFFYNSGNILWIHNNVPKRRGGNGWIALLPPLESFHHGYRL